MMFRVGTTGEADALAFRVATRSSSSKKVGSSRRSVERPRHRGKKKLEAKLNSD